MPTNEDRPDTLTAVVTSLNDAWLDAHVSNWMDLADRLTERLRRLGYHEEADRLAYATNVDDFRSRIATLVGPMTHLVV